MNKREIKYCAAGGEYDIYGLVYLPDSEQTAKGVVQIAHGMCEHVGRYESVAEFLVEQGYIVCANDHAGHGKSFNNLYGYMGDKDGYKHMTRDMHNLYLMTSADYRNLPYFLLGHSMGSFLARYYAAQYGEGLRGIIYSGTGDMGPLADVGILLAKLMIKLRGPKAEGLFLDRLTKVLYNSRIPQRRTNCDWLSRDPKVVDAFMQDESCQFSFTNAGYLDLFRVIREVGSDSWAQNVPQDTPVYIFSGDQDPVGNYGKSCRTLRDRLLAAGCKKVDLKLYPGGRHEMLNETNRQEVYRDLINWIDALV